jgi:hypothetical protein
LGVGTYTRQSAAQLSHGLVEGDVLENLDPGEEDADSNDVVVPRLPEAEELEIGELLRILQQVPDHPFDSDVSEDGEGDAER